MSSNHTCPTPRRIEIPTSARKRLAVAGLALLITGTLTGCASLWTPKTPEQVVSQLSTQRWQALLAGDFEKAYAFAAPSFRQIKTLDYYRSARQATPVKWLASDLVRVNCSEQRCTVTINLESKPLVPFPFAGTIKSGVEEIWILENGQWWMFETL
jgi:hypothetical protein